MAASSGEEGSNCAEARVESATSGQWQLRGGATGTHALLAARLGNRRISSKEDTGTNPSIIREEMKRYSDFDDLYQYFSNTAVFRRGVSYELVMHLWA